MYNCQRPIYPEDAVMTHAATALPVSTLMIVVDTLNPVSQVIKPTPKSAHYSRFSLNYRADLSILIYCNLSAERDFKLVLIAG